MNDDQMDAVFHALAHGDRRRVLDIVKQDPGCCVSDVAARFDSSRIAVMKHIGVLETARLLISEKVGRQRRLYFNAVPIQLIHERWTTEFSAHWANRLTRMKYAIEDTENGT